MLTTLSLAFLAHLVHTGAVERPTPTAAGVELAAKLTRAKSSATAERACSGSWERDSDAWWSCVVGLESWRGEVQGWATGGVSAVEIMPLPDPERAGALDWDAL